MRFRDKWNRRRQLPGQCNKIHFRRSPVLENFKWKTTTDHPWCGKQNTRSRSIDHRTVKLVSCNIQNKKSSDGGLIKQLVIKQRNNIFNINSCKVNLKCRYSYVYNTAVWFFLFINILYCYFDKLLTLNLFCFKSQRTTLYIYFLVITTLYLDFQETTTSVPQKFNNR